ncbi:hypothetical protein BE17_52515 [Sorangium cellulosum]|uniref:Uncharacterized protein n=1 Tax=Sorangium cellulosum TaxID=56 RepID=A0A150R0M2_SORCE|nr:hypothetical protein BE17_52515 [Sorangium cellulosum]
MSRAFTSVRLRKVLFVAQGFSLTSVFVIARFWIVMSEEFSNSARAASRMSPPPVQAVERRLHRGPHVAAAVDVAGPVLRDPGGSGPRHDGVVTARVSIAGIWC